jgi:hypothetical protein
MFAASMLLLSTQIEVRLGKISTIKIILDLFLTVLASFVANFRIANVVIIVGIFCLWLFWWVTLGKLLSLCTLMGGWWWACCTFFTWLVRSPDCISILTKIWCFLVFPRLCAWMHQWHPLIKPIYEGWWPRGDLWIWSEARSSQGDRVWLWTIRYSFDVYIRPCRRYFLELHSRRATFDPSLRVLPCYHKVLNVIVGRILLIPSNWLAPTLCCCVHCSS